MFFDPAKGHQGFGVRLLVRPCRLCVDGGAVASVYRLAPNCHTNTIAQFNNLDNAFLGTAACAVPNSLALLISTGAVAAPSIILTPRIGTNGVIVFNIFAGAAAAFGHAVFSVPIGVRTGVAGVDIETNRSPRANEIVENNPR